MELDSLRGIAALIVVLSHYTWAYDYHFDLMRDHEFHFPYGEFGVQLFFMISGFVIYMTLETCTNTKDFIVNRIARLFPTYWICIGLTTLWVFTFPVPTLGNYTLAELLINLTMLQTFLKIRHIDQVYWSLTIELLFYVIIGILHFFGQLKRIHMYCLLWLFLVALSLYLDFPFEKYLRLLLITEWAPYFIAGIMFYSLKYKQKDLYTHVIILICLAINLIFLFYREQPQFGHTHVPAYLVIVAFIAFYLIIYNNIAILKNRILVYFGEISYPLYLLHNVIGYSIIYRIRPTNDNQLVYVGLTIILTLLISHVVTMAMKTPSKLLKAKLNYYLG